MNKLEIINDSECNEFIIETGDKTWSQFKVVNHNGRLEVVADNSSNIPDESVYTHQEDTSSKFNQELIGNWFLYKDTDGCLFVTKDKPTLTDIGCFLGEVRKSGWMSLVLGDGEHYHNDKFTCGNWTLTSDDFNALSLPRVTVHSIKEIEIMPSGKVYFY